MEAERFLRTGYDPDLDKLVKEIERHEDYRTGPLGYGYNIERVGIPYGGIDGLWKTFFSRVSEHTDPFAFYVSPNEHNFPDVTDFDDGIETVWFVKCVDGDLYVEERTFEHVETEVVVDELDVDDQDDDGGEA